MKKHRPLFLILIGALLTIALVACGGAADTQIVTEVVEVTRVVEGETITEFVEVTRVVEVEPPAPDPTDEPASAEAPSGPKRLIYILEFWIEAGWAIETDDALVMTSLGMLETLVNVDFDGQMVPNLAESWTQIDDLTWEFKLRTDVTFQNGEPFNADAAANALNYLLTVDTPPRGFDPANITSIEAVGDDTLVITTVETDVLLPNRMTAPGTGMLAPSAYQTEGIPDAFGTGTGPFILLEEVPNQTMELVRNENYWGGTVNLDEVQVLFVPDGNVRATMLQTGEAHVVGGLPIPMIPILEADPDVTVVRSEIPRTPTMYLNNASGPVSDVNVRRALLHAIDKPLLVETVLEGIGAPAAGPFGPNEGWVDPSLTADTYDPDLAISLLSEAGYGEDNPLTIGLWTYGSRPALPPMAIAIQDMFADVGIATEVRIAQYGALIQDVENGNFDIFLVSRSHLLDNYDPEGFLSADFGCEGSFNLNLYCNPEVEALLQEARSISDNEARFDIYRELQQIIVSDDVASIFVYYQVDLTSHRNEVLNFKVHPLGHRDMTPELDLAR